MQKQLHENVAILQYMLATICFVLFKYFKVSLRYGLIYDMFKKDLVPEVTNFWIIFLSQANGIIISKKCKVTFILPIFYLTIASKVDFLKHYQESH